MIEQIRILAVDDELSTRKIIKNILKRKNYQLLMVESGEDALALLQEDQSFDLILLDFLMAGITGVEVLQQLKKDQVNIPVIMASALSEPEDMVEAFRAGASDYIIKPFNSIELIARIETQIMLNQPDED